MFSLIITITPIFLIIGLGAALRKFEITKADFWHSADRLVYWLFLPALIFSVTSTTQYSSDQFLKTLLILIVPILVINVLVPIACKAARLSMASSSSVLQGAARNNAFVALAIVSGLYGEPGIREAGLIISILIPMTNVITVSACSIMLTDQRGLAILKVVINDMMRNPLIIASVAGTLLNALYGQEVIILHQMLATLANAALPITLLSTGFALQLRKMSSEVAPLMIAIAGRFVVFPIITTAMMFIVTLDPLTSNVVGIFSCVPSAIASFPLARKLGGDIDLMANILVLQTLMAIVTVPLSITVISSLLGI